MLLSKSKIEKIARAHIDRMDGINSELKKAAVRSEHWNNFINNVHKNLHGVEALRMTKGKNPFKISTYEWCVQSLTETFMVGLERACNKRIESDIDKIKRQAELTKLTDMDKTARGEVSGDYADLVKEGVVLDAKR